MIGRQIEYLSSDFEAVFNPMDYLGVLTLTLSLA